MSQPENSNRLFELISGEIIEVSPGRTSNSGIGLTIAFETRLFCRDHRILCYTSDGAYEVQGHVVAPDFAFKRTPSATSIPILSRRNGLSKSSPPQTSLTKFARNGKFTFRRKSSTGNSIRCLKRLMSTRHGSRRAHSESMTHWTVAMSCQGLPCLSKSYLTRTANRSPRVPEVANCNTQIASFAGG